MADNYERVTAEAFLSHLNGCCGPSDDIQVDSELETTETGGYRRTLRFESSDQGPLGYVVFRESGSVRCFANADL